MSILNSSLFLAPSIKMGTESGQRLDAIGRAIPYPGLDPRRPSLDLAVFDNSASITASNDPVGNRFEEVRRAVKIVAAQCQSSASKVAVIHFDQPSRGDSGIVALNSPFATTRLGFALQVPNGANGSSEMGDSLAKAERLASRYPDHDVRLTILSDFQLMDDASIFDRLRSFPGQVHAVVLEADPPLELYGDNITLTKVLARDPVGAVAAALHRSLTATRPGRRLSAVHAARTQPSTPPLSPS